MTRLARTLGFLFAALVIAACDPGADKPRSDTPEPTTVSSNALHETQVFHKGNQSEPQTLDPHKAEGVPSSNILRDLFEGLTSEDLDGSVIPGAAESWTISDDGTVYTFTLRANKWSNGDRVYAQDFEFGLKRSADPATLSKYGQILQPIVNAEAIVNGELPADELGVRALDDKTLEITLNTPTPYFLGLLNHSTTYAVHRASVEEHGNRFSRPGNLVSNGAYQLQEWVPQSHIRLVRNPNYWENDKVVIDEVYYYPIEDQSSELKRYQANELDMTYEVPDKQIDRLRKQYPDELVISPWLGTYYYGFNLTRPPFKDNLALRKAISMAIDREIVTKAVTRAGEIPAYGWVPPVTGYTGQKPEWADWPRDKQLAEAQRLYAEAGYGPGNQLKTTLIYNTQENHKRIAVAIAGMLKEYLGMEVSLLNQEWKVFLETRKQKVETQIFRAGWIGDYNDPFTFSELMRTGHGLNDSDYRNPEYDDLLERASAEQDMEKRIALLEEAERLIIRDIPIAPIYFYVAKRLVKPWVGGYSSNIMDHHYTKNFFIREH